MTNSGKQCNEDGPAEDRRTVILLVLFLLPVYLLLASLRIGSGDGETVYRVTRAIVNEGRVAIPAPSANAVVVGPFGEPIPPERLKGGGPYGAWGKDGRYYAQYGVGQSFLAIPLYLLGACVHRLTGWGTEGFVTRAAVSLLNPLALAIAGGALYRLARRLGYACRAALVAALAVAFCTPLWVYGKRFFSEPLVTLALVVAVLAAVRADEGLPNGWLACGAAVGGAVLVKPVALAAAPAFLAFAVLRRKARWWSAGLVAVPLATAVVGVAAYNWARFGFPLDTGYRTAAWNVAPWIGLWGLLLSSGKGLLWYCPPLVLGLAGLGVLGRRRARAAALMGGASLLYLLAHASYNHWHGGGSWGPRLILPIVPLVVLPLAEWIERPPQAAWARLGLALLLAAGMVLQMPAVLAYPPRALQSLYDRSATATEYTLRLLYRPADSPLLSQWRSLLEVAALTRDVEARVAVGEMAQRERDETSAQKDWLTRGVGLLSFNVLDIWPVTWAVLGAPPGVLLAVEGALFAAAGTAARALWRRTR